MELEATRAELATLRASFSSAERRHTLEPRGGSEAGLARRRDGRSAAGVAQAMSLIARSQATARSKRPPAGEHLGVGTQQPGGGERPFCVGAAPAARRRRQTPTWRRRRRGGGGGGGGGGGRRRRRRLRQMSPSRRQPGRPAGLRVPSVSQQCATATPARFTASFDQRPPAPSGTEAGLRRRRRRRRRRSSCIRTRRMAPFAPNRVERPPRRGRAAGSRSRRPAALGASRRPRRRAHRPPSVRRAAEWALSGG